MLFSSGVSPSHTSPLLSLGVVPGHFVSPFVALSWRFVIALRAGGETSCLSRRFWLFHTLSSYDSSLGRQIQLGFLNTSKVMSRIATAARLQSLHVCASGTIYPPHGPYHAAIMCRYLPLCKHPLCSHAAVPGRTIDQGWSQKTKCGLVEAETISAF